jgi:hypothetical protein
MPDGVHHAAVLAQLDLFEATLRWPGDGIAGRRVEHPS